MVHLIAGHDLVQLKNPAAVKEDEQLQLGGTGKDVGQEQRKSCIGSPDVKWDTNGAEALLEHRITI